ncbi:hypothetical protein [Amycolatopsis anabasis]|uniref:hypothetical protein n=1 Tax=Amycolatopsis anabasis TaxID=1840409 RepID=UPI00131EBF40|nr:hypothetical protein [Amycolatopsis anabasis]
MTTRVDQGSWLTSGACTPVCSSTNVRRGVHALHRARVVEAEAAVVTADAKPRARLNELVGELITHVLREKYT